MSLAAPFASEPETRARAAPTSYAPAPLALALAVFALCAFAPAVLNDGDTFSHIATGEWILDHHAVPHSDPFSFSFAGAPWTAHEWLSEVLLALGYRVAGWAGVMLLTGAAAALGVYVVARRVVAELAGPAGLVLAFVSLAMIAPVLLARPHILALPCVAYWASALFDARARDRAPPLALALVMLVWANLHGGFAFGLALIVPFALEAVIVAPAPDHGKRAKSWALFLGVSLIAALDTPFSIEGLLFPIKLLGNAQLANIGEWRAEDFSHPGPLEIFLLGLIGFALLKPLRLVPLSAVLLVGLIHLSLQHARHELLLAVVAPMLLARPVGEALQAGDPGKPASARLVIVALVAALALAGARLALPGPSLDSVAAPSRALAAVPPELRAKNVLNGYGNGGYLIFAKVKPFIDGRADMFGADFMSLYHRIASGEPEAIEEALKRYEIAWTIFPPNQGAVAILDREPGWKRLYADSHAIVHARDAVLGPATGLRGRFIPGSD
jgi:hypothetical protein